MKQFLRKIIGFRYLVEYFETRSLKKMWRRRNSHNGVHIFRPFNIDCVEVGKHSYGPLYVWDFGRKNPSAYIKIGNYVSIAPGVEFFLNERHQIDTVSTFPFSTHFGGENMEMDGFSKGPIIVEDEVWIGAQSVILSGVRIGKGSIISACSLVKRDVPPYSIVEGNPAKVIRYRFSEEVIGELEKLDLSRYDDNAIKRCLDCLYKKISTVEDVRTLRDKLEYYNER